MFQRNKWKILRGDKVQIMAGRDAGQVGTVLKVIRDSKFPRVVVEGQNLVSGRAGAVAGQWSSRVGGWSCGSGVPLRAGGGRQRAARAAPLSASLPVPLLAWKPLLNSDAALCLTGTPFNRSLPAPLAPLRAEQAPHQAHQGQPGRHRQRGVAAALLQRAACGPSDRRSCAHHLALPGGWHQGPRHKGAPVLGLRSAPPRGAQAATQAAPRLGRPCRHPHQRCTGDDSHPRRPPLLP